MHGADIGSGDALNRISCHTGLTASRASAMLVPVASREALGRLAGRDAEATWFRTTKVLARKGMRSRRDGTTKCPSQRLRAQTSGAGLFSSLPACSLMLPFYREEAASCEVGRRIENPFVPCGARS